MTTDRWNRIKELYAAALDMSGEQRPVFIAEACGSDAELRDELESLLKSAEQAGAFLEARAIEVQFAPVRPAYPRPGDRLGVYAIVQQVAEGGMGAVYQAVRDDDAFRKLVAVKILKRGMDTDYILRRFENEKQILAHFDHPYIARLLDAGITPDHRPFFVMEFYSGVPLDRYCQERRPSLEARIRLFQKICAAVEYAHENLIVHRDLKPGNILITADGEPRLLDFGIAKLMADDRQMTGLGVRVMTPGYASPEQIRGDAVTTASDIYSLGVLLYEVLTGRHPFPRRTEEPFISSALDLDKDPKAPSTLIRNSAPSTDSLPEGVSSARQWSHLLRGDLDRIVLKAMAAEPSRRYRTVDQLSADLGRFLDGLPVSACGSSIAYRITKFTRRNWVAVSCVVLFVVALSAALVAASYEARTARRAQALAERHASHLRRLAESLVFDVHDAIENLPGATPAREKLLTRATEALDHLQADAADDRAAQIELADAYSRLGAVHGSPSESNLGRTEDALADFKKAAALLEKAAASGSGPEVLAPLAQVYDQTARVLKAMGRKVEANECYRKSINIREQLFNQNPHSLDAQRSLAAARFTAARMEIDAGNLRPALDLARRSLGEYEAAVAADPAHAQTRFALALNAKTLAAIETQLGDFNAAERYAARALEIDRARLAASPEDANIPLDISFDLSERAEAEIGRRDFMAALSDYRQALELREGLLRQDPNNERLRDRTAYVSGKIGLLLMDMGRTPEAQPHVRRQYALLQPLAADANNVTRRVRFAEARGNLGAWYCQSGQKDRGRGLLASAIAEITDMRESQRITYSDMLPLARLHADAKACGLASAASQE